MLIRRFLFLGFCCVSLVSWNAHAAAASYPDRPIRFVTTKVGGGNDLMTRAIAQAISGPLGQPVVVENRPSDLIGEIAARASADGYTLLFGGASLWILPFLQEVRYDPVKDFAPVSMVERSPRILVVNPSVPVSSIKDLIAYAKAKPGELNHAYSAADSRLAAELFKAMAGVNIVNVAYSTSAVQYSDLLSGQVQLTFGSTAIVMPLLKAGKLRALGVTTLKPSSTFPDLPAIAATVPGYEASAMAAVFVPASTPKPVVRRLNQEIVRYLNTTTAKERFASAGSEAVSSSPDEAAAVIKTDMSRLSKVIKDTGMRAE